MEQPHGQEQDHEKRGAEIRKLRLEILTLERQNSWRGHVPFIATFATVLATLFGAWMGFTKFRSDSQRELDLRQQEIERQTEAQYQADLQQLVQSSLAEKQALTYSVFLLHDLNRLIEIKIPPQQREERRRDVGETMLHVIRGRSVDFSRLQDVEFDLAALENCDYLKDTLRAQPDSNVETLGKYSAALAVVQRRARKMVKTAEFKPPIYYELDIRPGSETDATLLVNLLNGYKERVELLKKAGHAEAWERADRIRWQRSFCWFYDATHNGELAKGFFELDDNALMDRWKRCPENEAP